MSASGKAWAILAAVSIAILAHTAIAEETQMEAVWRPQRATFKFFGGSTFYACEDLANRLKHVLLALGAHTQIYIDRSDCIAPTDVRLHITFMSPIEATDANVHALTTFDTKSQLVARLHGITLPTAADLSRFPAEWQAVTLSHDRKLDMRAGDCELLEQIRRQILPRLAARDTTKPLLCMPGHLGGRPPRLTVSTLVASTE